MRSITLAACALSLMALPTQAQVTPASKSQRRGSSTSKTKLKPGQIMISVKDGDLQRDVLAEFERQVGVKIKWVGPARTCSLRLIEPVEWETALDLVCQFTKTHVASSRGNKILLKDKFGGEIDDDVVFDDLDGQVRTPRRLQAAALLASAPRNMPTSQPRNAVPTVTLGGGTLRMGPRGAAPRPYVGRPYVSRAQPARPYVARNRPARPYVGRPYVSRSRPARPYVGRTRPARPYVGKPYVARNRPARPYVPARQPVRRQTARNPQPGF